MRKRFVFAAVCILALPLLFSPSQNDGQTHQAAFSTVAFAGRTTLGGWCECGAGGCFCDPGEQPIGQSAGPVSDRNSRNQSTSPVSPARTQGFDFGSSALLLAFAFFLWTRLRA